MHLENIVFHVISVIVIYSISCRLLGNSGLAGIAALLFAVHPVNVEVVGWISARTDLLAGLFCFLSFFVLLQYKNLFLASFFYLMALVCKETAIGLLFFIIPFIFWYYPKKFVGRERLFFLFSFILVTLIYLFMRFPELRSVKHGTQNILEDLLPKGKGHCYGSVLYQIGVCFKVIGFYFKKLLIPWPLNFAIVKINGTFYLVLGILIIVLLLLFFFMERGLISISTMWCLCFIVPAIYVALRKVAWTPLAERYMYISSLGISLMIPYLYTRIRTSNIARLSKWALAVYIFSFCVSAGYRSYIWQDNLRLYTDAVQKSPDFGPVHNELAIALFNKGRIKEAKKHFDIAARLTKGYQLSPLAEANFLILSQKDLTPEQVLKKYDRLIKESKGDAKRFALEGAISYIEKAFRKGRISESKREFFYIKEIEYLKELSRISDSAFCHYRMGQLFLALRRKKEAFFHFKSAYKLSSRNAFFRPAAHKLMERLKKEQR